MNYAVSRLYHPAPLFMRVECFPRQIELEASMFKTSTFKMSTFKQCVIPVALVLSLSWALTAQDAKSVISDASKAMGADGLKTIQYSGPSSEYSFGQAFKPGSDWPVWKNKSYMRTIDFEAPAIRMDRVADPLDPSRRG